MYFKYYEEIVSGSESILDNIVGHINDLITAGNYGVESTESPTMNQWRVVSQTVDATTGHIKSVILSTVTGNDVDSATPVSAVKGYYWKPSFTDPAKQWTQDIAPDPNNEAQIFIKINFNGLTDVTKHSELTMQMIGNVVPAGAVVNGTTLAADQYTDVSPTVTYQWANEAIPTSTTDRDVTKPIYSYLHLSNNKMAMVLVADPAVNFTDYRKSFMYFGALKNFKYNQDSQFANVALTVGSVAAEGTPDVSYGQFTSTAQNSIMMYKTKSGIRFQKHYPAFITQAPDPSVAYNSTNLPAVPAVGATPQGNTGLLLETQGFNASQWTKKYHLSPIYIVHPYDGYRGMLEDVIAVSKNNILHLDELNVAIDPGTYLKPWTQETYKYFDHNTENNFMNRSANIRMGLGFLTKIQY